MRYAFIFPGQGAQTIGMGLDLAQNNAAAKAVFQEVDDTLGESLSDLIWQGDIETLTLTQNAQPALMATSIAAMRALGSAGVEISDATYVAGHSLGEYTALCAAGALSLADSARLLRIRGQAMQEAVPIGIGAMAAILGLDFQTVAAIAAQAAQGQCCQAENVNDPAQVVVSGHKEAVERAADMAKKAGAKRALLLPVSAPFHCALMQPAADRMAQALAEVDIKPPAVPVVANVLAHDVSAPDAIREHLIAQVTGSVRWRESIAFMAQNGVTSTFEIGAGKALSGMVRRIERDMKVHTVGDMAGLKAAVEILKKGA